MHRRAAPTIGKYTVSNPSGGAVNADGTVQIIDGKAPLDPVTNLIFNDRPLSWAESSVECNKMCAHLATFTSQADQHEAEAYYKSQVGPTGRHGARQKAATGTAAACRPAPSCWILKICPAGLMGCCCT
jgi:hypothetical protein